MDAESILIAARDAAFQAVQEKNSRENRKAWRRACRELTDYQAKQAADGGEIFPTILDVVVYLDGEGWKISKATAYMHWKQEGKIKARPEGGFTLEEVLEYARVYLKKKDGTPGAIAGENLQENKIRAEVRRTSADAEIRELKARTMAGELISRSQVEIELAERATNLRSYLDAVARKAAGRVIKIVGGDPQKAPELISWMIGMNHKALDNYSRPIKGMEEE